METKTIRKEIFIFGGFHNVRPMKFFVPEDAFDALIKGDKATFIDKLSDRQRRRLWKHLCGMTNCLCGGRDWEWR